MKPRDIHREIACLKACKGVSTEALEAGVVVGLIDAANAWWTGRRPVSWSYEQHMENPTINAVTPTEKSLALAISKILRGLR